jgi:ribonuclease P protein component
MLPKYQRLKNSREFSVVYNLRKSTANSLLILYTGRVKQASDIPAKAGFVVSKKISKSSAKRNRIKRLTREAYRNIIKKFGFCFVPWDKIIFIARDDSLQADYYKIYDAVLECLDKAARKFGTGARTSC